MKSPPDLTTVSPAALRRAMREVNVFSGLQMAMAQIAEIYANAGIPVFPVRPDNRAPYLPKPSKGKGGFHQRSADPDTVAAWWGQFPDALVGIVPGDADTVAYDVDSEKAARAAVARGLLDPASFTNGSISKGLIVQSAGKSQPFKLDGVTLPPMHLYRTVPPDTSIGALKLEGEVTRYLDGYVVAPGSWRKEAEDIREYLLLSDAQPQPLPPPPEDDPTQEWAADASGVPTAQSILEGAELPEGSRHDGLLKVSTCLARLMPSEAAVLTRIRRIDADQCIPPLSREGSDGEKELANIAKSAWKKFGGIADADGVYERLVGLQRELDELDGPRRAAHEAQRLGEIAREFSADRRVLRSILDEMRLSERQRSEQWSSIDPGHELVDQIVEAGNPYLVQDVLFQQADHVLYGSPESLKTFTALDWAGAIATGRRWLGKHDIVTSGTVVIFAGEGQINLRRRLAAWLKARGISAEDARSVPIRIYDQLPILGRGDDGFHTAIAKVEEAQKEFGQPVQLIVIDTLTRLSGRAGLSMTKVEDFGALLDDISALGKRFGASTLTLAHHSKSDPHNPAGTFQLSANADCVIAAKRQESGGSELRTVLSFEKTKDGERPSDILIRFQQQVFNDFLAESLRSRDKETLDSDAVLDGRYTSLAAVWDGNTVAPPKGEVSGESGLTEHEWNVLNTLARLVESSPDGWVSQKSLFEEIRTEYQKIGKRDGVTSPIPDTTLRRMLKDRLAKKLRLARWKYVDPKRPQAGILWTLTDEGHLETSGVVPPKSDGAKKDDGQRNPSPSSANPAPAPADSHDKKDGDRQTVADDAVGGAR